MIYLSQAIGGSLSNQQSPFVIPNSIAFRGAAYSEAIGYNGKEKKWFQILMPDAKTKESSGSKWFVKAASFVPFYVAEDMNDRIEERKDWKGKVVVALNGENVSKEENTEQIKFLFVLFDRKDGENKAQTLGGCVEKEDVHWKHTALREFVEESGVCPFDVLSLLSSQHGICVYSPVAAHMFWFYEVTF